jgi:hypothetical protein
MVKGSPLFEQGAFCCVWAMASIPVFLQSSCFVWAQLVKLNRITTDERSVARDDDHRTKAGYKK